QDNPISELDISQNILLESLWAGNNNLTSIDISNNTENLYDLQLWGNQISGIDVTQHANLALLAISGTLTEIDVSNNTDLGYLSIEGNITELDVSNNLGLTYVVLKSNPIEVVDLSNNLLLETLSCQDNQFSQLIISNGNNENLSLNV